MSELLDNDSPDITVEYIEKLLEESLLSIQGHHSLPCASNSMFELDSLSIEIFLSEVEDRLVDICPLIIGTNDLINNPSQQQFAFFLVNKINSQRGK